MTIVQKFEPEEKKSTYPKKYGVLISLTLFSLVIIEIWASNIIVTHGEKYENLSRLSKSLQMENQVLENEIAKNSSLVSVASKSAQLGFYKTESIQYIR